MQWGWEQRRVYAMFLRWSRTSGVITFVAATVVLAGWALGVEELKRIFPAAVSMKVNTAIGLLLLGTSIFLRTESPTAVACACGAALVGAATLAEYCFSLDLGIDQLIWWDEGDSGTFYPGRQSPITAAALVLMGSAAAFCRRRSPWRAWTGQIATSGAMLIALTALVGYLYGIRQLYGPGPHFTQMAVHTSVAFLIAGSGILAMRPADGFVRYFSEPSSAGRILRRLAPSVVLMLIGLGWIRLQGERAGFYDTGVGLWIMVLASSIFSVALIGWTARSVRAHEAGMRAVQAQLEQRVRERTADLEAFTYSVSHDLRAPLRAIDGFSRILLEDHAAHLDGEGKRVLGVVREGATTMGRLIDDLLEFSRVGRQEMAHRPVDMGALAQGALSEILRENAGRTIRTSVALLPPVVGDPSMLMQVWRNLLSNAAKYTRPRDAAQIDVDASADGAETVYRVRDNGVGFDMRYSGKLFEVFQRLHSPEEFPGTGVGLALVRRIVKRHGGRVWAESSPGSGATFHFSLPKEGGARGRPA